MSNPTANELKDYLARRADTGNWFIVFDDYLEIMSIEAAWVLQRIINLGKCKPKTPDDIKMRQQGYVRVSTRFLQKKTKLNPDAQGRVLRELQGWHWPKEKPTGQKRKKQEHHPDKVYVEVVRKGLPAKRYVKVDLLAIEAAITRAKSTGISQSREIPNLEAENVCNQGDGNTRPLAPEISGGSKRKVRKEKKEKHTPAAATPTAGCDGSLFSPKKVSSHLDSTPPTQGRASSFLSKLLARQLILGSHRYNTAAWEKEFVAIERDLVQAGYDESDATSEVTTILELYGNRAGSDRFLCKAYSGKSFREKYTSIRAYFIDRKEYIPDHEFLMGEEMPEIVESYKEYHPDGSFTIKFKEDGQ